MPKTIGSSQFNQTAEKLARNPLGIIALFIVLVYGMAALVLGFASAKLAASDRSVLVWFLVLFPVAVLLAFYRLVTDHHSKLYAPRDFHDPEGFFRALTPTEQKARLEHEIREFEAPVDAMGNRGFVEVEKEPQGANRPPLRQEWVLAEELAFRELEREFRVQLNRQVAMVGPDTGVDGAFVRGGKVTIVEVKLTRPGRFMSALQSAVAQVKKLAGDTDAASYVVAIVVDGLASLQAEHVDKAQEVVKAVGTLAELRLYDFDQLKRRYGIDASSTAG